MFQDSIFILFSSNVFGMNVDNFQQMEREHPDESAPPTNSKDNYPVGGEYQGQIPPPGPRQPYVMPG